jgi:hypothetical protein
MIQAVAATTDAQAAPSESNEVPAGSSDDPAAAAAVSAVAVDYSPAAGEAAVAAAVEGNGAVVEPVAAEAEAAADNGGTCVCCTSSLHRALSRSVNIALYYMSLHGGLIGSNYVIAFLSFLSLTHFLTFEYCSLRSVWGPHEGSGRDPTPIPSHPIPKCLRYLTRRML